MATTEEIIAKIKALAKDDGLPCVLALKLANEENVAPKVIGNAANEAKIKINSCQLERFLKLKTEEL